VGLGRLELPTYGLGIQRAVCRYGSVAVLMVQNESVDACDACLATLRERQQLQLASNAKLSQIAAKLRKVAAEMEKMVSAQSEPSKDAAIRDPKCG